MARNTRANLREVAAPVTWKLILQSLELYMLYENTTGLTWTDSVDPVDSGFTSRSHVSRRPVTGAVRQITGSLWRSRERRT